MTADMGWKAGLVFWLVVGSVGCGREEPLASAPKAGDGQNVSEPLPPVSAPMSPEPEPEPAPMPAPAPLPPLPVEGPVDASWWQVNPEPSAMTFELPACVPVRAMTGKRFTHPCTVKQFGPQGALVHFQRLDSAGRTLEEARYLDETQTRLWRTLHTYDDLGREATRVHFPGAGPESTTTAFRYDEAGRLRTMESAQERTDHVYNARGDLSFVEQVSTLRRGSIWRKYIYAPNGQLETLWYADYDYCNPGPSSPVPSCGAYQSRHYTYHPNGRVKQERFERLQDVGGLMSTTEFDERGRQVSYIHSVNESGGRTTWIYDERDLRVKELYSGASSTGTTEGESRWLYDAAGQTGAEHFVLEWVLPYEQPPRVGRKATLNRYFHACGSGDLLFAEQDTNEDGARDGWRELLRDAAGNLRLERYHGSLIPEAQLSRVEYDYSCRE